MDILYISNLSNDIAAGLTWSVPAGIEAQKEYDNVLWINLSDSSMEHWENTGVYHKLKDFSNSLHLKNLPHPFCRPDVVVFEGFYHLSDVFFSWELRKQEIPYIIIPRGSLTKQAFHNHNWINFLKKKIACLLLFKPYTRNALAIQYLTNQEYNDSGDSWTKEPVIIPNGFDKPLLQKNSFSKNGLELIYIGRPTIYHKGLDLLIKACVKLRDFMKTNGIHISMHVPKKNDYEQLVSMIKEAKVDGVLTLKDAVTGKTKENSLMGADVFIMTSRYEGHPMGLIEALAYGLPVLVTPGTNMASEVFANNAGWVAKEDVNDIACGIKTIYEERNLLKEKGRNAAELANDYRWTVLAGKFHNELLGRLNK